MTTPNPSEAKRKLTALVSHLEEDQARELLSRWGSGADQPSEDSLARSRSSSSAA